MDEDSIAVFDKVQAREAQSAALVGCAKRDSLVHCKSVPFGTAVVSALPLMALMDGLFKKTKWLIRPRFVRSLKNSGVSSSSNRSRFSV